MDDPDELFGQVGEMKGEAAKSFGEDYKATGEFKLEFEGFVCPQDFVSEFTPLEFEEVGLLMSDLFVMLLI